MNQFNKFKSLGKAEKPIPLDEAKANEILTYLGNQPWIEVQQLINYFQDLMRDYVLNMNLAIENENSNE